MLLVKVETPEIKNLFVGRGSRIPRETPSWVNIKWTRVSKEIIRGCRYSSHIN